jgi:hypothetical protein
LSGVLGTVTHALQITGFVAVMMLLVEYLNVRTQGNLQSRLPGSRWGQYVLAAFLGALPGCLGAFAIVALYTHRAISFGALVAAMLATAGDESFVMFAMIPREALFLHIALFFLGIAAGAATDAFARHRPSGQGALCTELVVHEPACGNRELLQKGQIIRQWRNCSASRGVLVTALALLLIGTLIGEIGPAVWNWVRVTILLVTTVAILISATVSDHFLEEHFWNHVVLRHVPRVFLWTCGALIAMHLLASRLDLSDILQREQWVVLLLAVIIGVIPESGPHMVFVTLYAKGLIPVSILFASSIVQDGHGMLPLLAQSRRAFVLVKAVNVAIALAIGAAGLAIER